SDIFKRLGAEVVVINNNPDGFNINTNCGSTHSESLQRAVVNNKANLGLAFDGDADRCLACDEKGKMLDGDHMLMLFANTLKEQNRLNHNRLVTTVMANLGLEEACQKFGVTMVRTAVGDRYVLEEMLSSGAVLGGEQSGHIIFSDYSTTGDGMLTGIMLAQVLAKAKKLLSELAEVVAKKPQYLLNIKVKDKNNWNSSTEVKDKVKEVEERLKGQGRLLIRPSGTENLLRIMAEGPDIEQLKELIGSIAKTIEDYT
ncbi:phosphoglucosamine mutase, partial [bacterium]|nr:phosphoglucosamine mutase [bacterium]